MLIKFKFCYSVGVQVSSLLRILNYLVTTVLSRIILISKFLFFFAQLWKLEIWSQCIQILKGNVKEEPKNLKESKFSLEMGFQNWVAVKSLVLVAHWSKSIVTAIYTYNCTKGRKKMGRHFEMLCTVCETTRWLWQRPLLPVWISSNFGVELVSGNIIELCHLLSSVASQWR